MKGQLRLSEITHNMMSCVYAQRTLKYVNKTLVLFLSMKYINTYALYKSKN